MLTACTTGLRLNAISSDTVGSASGLRRQIDRRAAELGIGAVRGDKSAFVGIDQHLKLVRTHQREAAERGAQNPLIARVVFDDQAAADEVEAGALDALLRLQPGQSRLGELSLTAQRRQVQADAPGDKVADREFHCADPRIRSQFSL